jgi:hypothetical protein
MSTLGPSAWHSIEDKRGIPPDSGHPWQNVRRAPDTAADNPAAVRSHPSHFWCESQEALHESSTASRRSRSTTRVATFSINYGSQSFEWSYLCGAAGTIFRKSNRSSGWSPTYTGGSSYSSGAMPPDQRPPERESERTGPNGRFEHSPKHGPRAYGNVSAAPKDGQAALDVSVPKGAPSNGRFGYSEGQFVKFQQTSDGVFHGYQIPWAEVPQNIRQLWQAEGVVTAGGRFCLSAGASL